jgi:hypothetical protein
MDNLLLKGTKTTPEVEMRFDQQFISMKGEAYPENAVAFFGKLIEELRKYLAVAETRKLRVEMNLKYLNSASTKMLYKFVEELNMAAKKGRPVELAWCFESDDSMLQEFGEDLQDSFGAIDIKFVTYA